MSVVMPPPRVLLWYEGTLDHLAGRTKTPNAPLERRWTTVVADRNSTMHLVIHTHEGSVCDPFPYEGSGRPPDALSDDALPLSASLHEGVYRVVDTGNDDQA